MKVRLFSLHTPSYATLLCLLALPGCKTATDTAADVAVSVEAQHPSVGPIAEQIEADATLAPLAQAAIAPKISSPVHAFYVARGSRVHKGQLLALLEDRDLKANAMDSSGTLASAKATYAAATRATIPEDVQRAELDVRQAAANLSVANRTAEERRRLLNQGAIAGRDVDTAVAAAVQAQAAYDMAAKHLATTVETTRAASGEAAQGQLTSAEGRYLNAAAQVSYARVVSPIDGVVTDRPLFAGETANAGTPVITVMETSSLLAKVHLAQSAAQKLKVGSPAKVTVPGIDQPISGVVTLLSPALDPGSTTVEVWIKLPNGDGALKAGTPVHVVITGRSIAHALQVPVAALLPAENGAGVVMVVGGDGAAHRRAVQIGMRTTASVQITGGLAAGDDVITSGAYGLDDGTKVTLAAAHQSSAKPRAGEPE